MNRLQTFLYVAVFCLLSLTSTAQVPELVNNYQFRNSAKAAVDSIYNFNPEAADSILQPWEKRYPEHPIWTLFEGMKFWWEVLSDLEDTSHDEQFYHMMKKADYESSRLLRNNSSHADGLIIKAISNGYLARQHANREGWLSSLNYSRKAMNAHEYLMEVQPQLNDLKLAEGLKLYYLEYLPKAYPVVKTVSWTLPDGNKVQGLKLLREASKEAIFARAEAIYFLGNINHNYEKDYKAATESFKQLYSKYPNNNYYVRLLVKNYYRMNKYNEALQVIDSTLVRWKQHSLPHKKVLQEELLTWKGRILEQRGNYSEALKSYSRAFQLGKELPQTKNRSFYVISGYHAGKLSYKKGSLKKAKSYLRQTSDANAEHAYRKRAQKLLSKLK